MAGQVKVDAELFAAYDWSGRTIEYPPARIRKFHDFREPTVGDEDKLADRPATKICPAEIGRQPARDHEPTMPFAELAPGRPAQDHSRAGGAAAADGHQVEQKTTKDKQPEPHSRITGCSRPGEGIESA
ncbi:hypothetical protein AB0K21_04785 [Streptosporangium sp. NPDC049248]|uniref:hypothetical protein n=1 Tax=Streptosporangium sp. NPDC049248 TaxID=3155651 RepID=UPI003428C1DF